MLGLIVTTCHPALAPHTQIALTLRLVAGIDTPSIAAAFLVSEETMTQRLVRAKRKLRAGHVTVRSPRPEELPLRLPQVLAVLSLVFNEGHLRAADDGADRLDLVDEAIHLGRVLVGLLPEEPEVRGLLAPGGADRRSPPGPDRSGRIGGRAGRPGPLPLGPRDDRRGARPGPMVPAPEPTRAFPAPRGRQRRARECADVRGHGLAADPRVARPAPRRRHVTVVELNRTVAVAEVHGPAITLELVEQLPLDDYYLWHATRADLLRRTARPVEAQVAYRLALRRSSNPAEQRLLRRRLDECSAEEMR